jgi:membrane-bound metal-dependent hydrolase YbcI (DUF457 family)
MMVGHAALAFAIAALLAHRLGFSPERALSVGLVAGLFAVVPDVDMGYAFIAIATAGTLDLSVLQATFWDAGLTVHRGMTHSLVVGGIAALGFGLTAFRSYRRLAGVAVLGSLFVGTILYLSLVEVGVMLSFLLAGIAVVAGARYFDIGPKPILGAALVGVLSHPFGDIFTGSAPELFYPLNISVLPHRVLLSPDPTLHLLLSFVLELLTIWFAVAVYLRFRDERLSDHVHRRAVFGAGYAAAILALPAPTLAVSYHFVFSVLAVGLVGVSVDLPLPDLSSQDSRRTTLVTALAAISMAWLGYTTAYAFLQLSVLV